MFCSSAMGDHSQVLRRSVSGLPLPQTLAGAIRTALLRGVACDFAKMKGAPTFVEAVERACPKQHQWIGQLSIRGPWLARRRTEPDSIEVLVPAPAILQGEKDQRSKRAPPPCASAYQPTPRLGPATGQSGTPSPVAEALERHQAGYGLFDPAGPRGLFARRSRDDR